MAHQSGAAHIKRTEDFLEHLRAWVGPRNDVRALVVVGSFARGEARPTSDVDVVLLTTQASRYIQSADWVSEFGPVQRVELEAHGRVTSVRTTYDGGLEVEFGIAAADWASPPVDSGSYEVARHGIVVLMDRDGYATALAVAVAPSQTRPQRPPPASHRRR